MEAEWLLDKKVEVGHAWGPTKWGGILAFDPYWPIPSHTHSIPYHVISPISREKDKTAKTNPQKILIESYQIPILPTCTPPTILGQAHARVQRLQADWDRRSIGRGDSPGIPKKPKSPAGCFVFPVTIRISLGRDSDPYHREMIMI